MLSPDESLALNENITADIEPVKQFLSNALQKKGRGESFLYNQLIQQLNSRTDHDMLWRLYYGLAGSVSVFMRR
jgi:hypothetical protein